jgi:putative NADH-flavin reductase
VIQGDATDAAQVARAVAGVDAVVNAYNPGWDHPDLYAEFRRGTEAVLAGVKQAGVKRVLVVGGAGSLFVAPGVQLVDTQLFADAVPPNIVPGAKAARDALIEIRKETELEWSFVSPPAMLAPGERLGRYRLGGEDLPMDGDHPAGISVADLAVAVADELERPQHVRARFTVASA